MAILSDFPVSPIIQPKGKASPAVYWTYCKIALDLFYAKNLLNCELLTLRATNVTKTWSKDHRGTALGPIRRASFLQTAVRDRASSHCSYLSLILNSLAALGSVHRYVTSFFRQLWDLVLRFVRNSSCLRGCQLGDQVYRRSLIRWVVFRLTINLKRCLFLLFFAPYIRCR